MDNDDLFGKIFYVFFAFLVIAIAIVFPILKKRMREKQRLHDDIWEALLDAGPLNWPPSLHRKIFESVRPGFESEVDYASMYEPIRKWIKEEPLRAEIWYNMKSHERFRRNKQ